MGPALQLVLGRNMEQSSAAWGAKDCTAVAGLCSVFVLVAISCYVYRINRKRPELPPSPGLRLPIVGHLHLVGHLPHQTVSHLSKIYGPLLFLHIGSFPALVANTPATAKLLLHTHDKAFSGRPQHLSFLRNVFGHSLEIAFSQPGPFWKRMRQLCFSEFFSHKRLDYFKPLRAQEVRSLLEWVYENQGKPVTLRTQLQATSMTRIARMVVGKSLEEIAAETPNGENMMEAVVELLDILGTVNVSDFIPCLAWMDVKGYDRRSKRVGRVANAVLQGVIDRRRRDRSSDEPARDFLDVLLGGASLDSKDPQLQIKDSSIRAIIIDMLAGGSDTSSIAIEWALLELLRNPKKLKILQEQLDRVVGSSRLVQESDVSNLPYLQAVVNETFRLHPIAPILLPHMSLEASQIFGYEIPANALGFVNVWAIHRDPNVWENPLDFSPERFLDKNIDTFSQQCKFIPFGGGRRICPGAGLGRLSVQHILANLVHAFNWRVEARPNPKESSGLFGKPMEPLVSVPLPRLSKFVLESLT